jgi:predicted small lipoprotein YifL
MLFLSMIVVLAMVAAVAATGLRGTCSLSDSAKIDCGYLGITQTECQNKGCCWASSSTSGTPWCFYESGVNPTCFNYQVCLIIID